MISDERGCRNMGWGMKEARAWIEGKLDEWGTTKNICPFP